MIQVGLELLLLIAGRAVLIRRADQEPFDMDLQSCDVMTKSPEGCIYSQQSNRLAFFQAGILHDIGRDQASIPS